MHTQITLHFLWHFILLYNLDRLHILEADVRISSAGELSFSNPRVSGLTLPPFTCRVITV